MGLVILVVFLCFSSAAVVSGHTFHSYSHQQPIDVSIDLSKEPWFSKYGSQEDLDFSGHLSFSHLPASKCLEDNSTLFDIAVLGFPFDETVSYRPGARFGPFSIRSGSRRQRTNFWDLTWGKSPSNWGAGMVDCGDAPISAYDNSVAIDQMEAAYDTLISRPVLGGVSSAYTNTTSAFAKDGIEHPRIVTLGGDHTIVLPILRSLYKVYGPVSVIHFDAHQDTGAVEGRKDQERITHGSYFSIAAEEKLMTNTSVHGGIRQKMGGISQVIHDEAVGFITISSEDIDDYGIHNVIKKIRERVGDTPVYLSLDIDTVDPSLAPATGTPEIGGWTTREMKRILRGLAGLNFVGADIVEVAPAYDHADITSIAAADIVFDFLLMMQLDSPPAVGHPGGPWDESDVLLHALDDGKF